MKKNEYIINLMTQFAMAKGIKNPDINSKLFVDEFANWILEMKQKGLDYLSFIDSFDSHPVIVDGGTAEIGKGKNDSVALDTDITLITPYLSDMRNESQSIIQGEFKVVESTPIILRDSKEYDGSELSRFITQNPYSPQSLSNWENLHNSGLSNITVGVYGDIHDKDLESKIKVIKSLKEKLLDDSYVEDYSTYKDSYFYAISSDRKILRRYLSR